MAPAPAAHLIPALIAAAGEQAGWRHVELFPVNIRNPHTHPAYALACQQVFAWCEHRGLALAAIRPFDVAASVKQLQPKQQLRVFRCRLAITRFMRPVLPLFCWMAALLSRRRPWLRTKARVRPSITIAPRST